MEVSQDLYFRDEIFPELLVQLIHVYGFDRNGLSFLLKESTLAWGSGSKGEQVGAAAATIGTSPIRNKAQRGKGSLTMCMPL